MDGEALKKKHRDLAAYARRRGTRFNYADDFASEALIKLMQGRKATTRELYIDFIRELHALKRTAVRNEYPLEDLFGGERPSRTGERDVTKEMEVEELLTCLDQPQRTAFLLINKWGFTESEIGYLFNVTQTRIHQILREAKVHLKFKNKHMNRVM